jgi:AcrR family transcriptional regulator
MTEHAAQGAAVPGLRERGKARRREAITRAAFELFAERGYDRTTVADIAERAEVAPRTVTLYSPSKQEIALSGFTERAQQLADRLRERAPGESLTAILGAWVDEKHAEPWRQGLEEEARLMFCANPELRALQMARMADAVQAGTEAVAKDTGTLPTDPGPRIAAAAAVAVMLAVGDSPPGTDMPAALATALRFLDGGLSTL